MPATKKPVAAPAARKLVSEIIDATPGVKRAIHVFTPALQHRLANKGSTLPVMALRSSLHDFNKFKLYQRIELLGPSSMDPLFDAPLTGTGGRGVAILFTEFALRVLLGPSSMDPLFDAPLTGTGGRGVAILFTEFALRVWRYEDEVAAVIDSSDGRKPDEVLADVLKKYERTAF